MPKLEPMSELLTFGIVGAGGVVKERHLPALSKMPGVVLAAVANRSVGRARAAAKEFGVDKVYEKWQDVVDDQRIDVVLVGTPPYLHEEVAIRALEQGKHVFRQARMAIDLDSALRMLAADRETSLTTMLCPAPHYLRVDKYIRSQLKQGDLLGEVRHVVVNHANEMFVEPHAPLSWRQRRDLNGINALDVGIVGEVLERWFGRVAEVSAIERTWVARRQADSDGHTSVETPDSLGVVGVFDSGATLTALFSGAVRGGDPHITIHGDKASLVCHPWSTLIKIRRSDGDSSYNIPPEEEQAWTVEEDFVASVRSGVKGNPSFVAGAHYMAFTQAVVEAAESGRRARLRDV